MAGPDPVGSPSTVPPVAAGSGSAGAPVATTGSENPKTAPMGKGSAASAGGTLPPAPTDPVETGRPDFPGIDAALIAVNSAVDAQVKAGKWHQEAVDSEKPDGIIKFRRENYERACEATEQALQILGEQIEKAIAGDSYNGPSIHPRTAEEWKRADSIAGAYLGKPGGTHVWDLAKQLGRIVDGVKTASNFEKSGRRDAVDYVTRPRPGESAQQRWINQFLRLACLLNDIRNTKVDAHIFAQLVIGCAEAMGLSSKKSLATLEGIVARYSKNEEITTWIDNARRLAWQ